MKKIKEHFIVFLLVTLGCVLVYWSVFSNEFIITWDDDAYVLDNPLLTLDTKEKVNTLLTEGYQGNYHPLTMLSLSFDQLLWGKVPFGYHLTNLLFHILNTILLYLLTWKLIRHKIIGFFTTMLFGLHPMHVESVAWVSERKDVLYLFFLLGTLLAYLQYLDGSKRKYLLLALGLSLLSLLSKPNAVVIPVLLCILDVWKGQKINLVMLVNKIPFILLALLFSGLTIYFQGSAEAISDLANYGIYQRIQLISYCWIAYLYKFLFPVYMSGHYAFPPSAAPFSIFMKAAPFILLLMVFLLMMWSRCSKYLGLGILFFTVSLLPVLHIIPVGSALMADRYTYLPYIGLGLSLAYYFTFLIRKFEIYKTSIYCLLMAFMVLLGLSAFDRTKVWKNDVTFWTDVIKKDPNTYIGRYGLGQYFLLQNDIEGCITQYQKVLEIYPNAEEPNAFIGILYNRIGDVEKAADHFDKVLYLNPEATNVRRRRGKLLLQLGFWEDAVVDFSICLEQLPNDLELYTFRAEAFLGLGKKDLAFTDWQAAVKRGTIDSKVYFNLGNYYYENHNLNQAINYLDKALQLNPNKENYKSMVSIVQKLIEQNG